MLGCLEWLSWSVGICTSGWNWFSLEQAVSGLWRMWKVCGFVFDWNFKFAKSFGLLWPCNAQGNVKEPELYSVTKLPCVSCTSGTVCRCTLPWGKHFEAPLPSFKKLPLNKTINYFSVQMLNIGTWVVLTPAQGSHLLMGLWWEGALLCLVFGCYDLDTVVLQHGLCTHCLWTCGSVHTIVWYAQLMNQCLKALLPIRARWAIQ